MGSGIMDHWSIDKNPLDRELNKWKRAYQTVGGRQQLFRILLEERK
jgi:hypothetical protein